MNRERILSEASAETKALMDALSAVAPGDAVSYDTLSAVINMDVQHEGYPRLHSARRILLRDEGVRFDVLMGEGLHRMTDSEVASSGAQSLSTVRRASKRETRKMIAVANFDGLSNEEKITHNATLSVLGAISHFTKPKQVAILEAAVANAKAQLPPKDSIEAVRTALLGGKK